MVSGHRMWNRETWQFPLWHDFRFSFGLGMDAADNAKSSTIVPYLFQDNAIVDYETIKTNPENADFVTATKPNIAAGSYVPKIMVEWKAVLGGVQPIVPDFAKFYTMRIHTAMLNRLDAFDKKTTDDIEEIIGLTHEITDEQAYPLWNTSDLYSGKGADNILHADVPGLTTTQAIEGVTWGGLEMFFDARKYYTNRQMLDQCTDRMMVHPVKKFTSTSTGFIPGASSVVKSYSNHMVPMCKFAHPYTFCGELFHIPLEGSFEQYVNGGQALTALEHLTVSGRVVFKEFNPDFNRARA